MKDTPLEREAKRHVRLPGFQRAPAFYFKQHQEMSGSWGPVLAQNSHKEKPANPQKLDRVRSTKISLPNP